MQFAVQAALDSGVQSFDASIGGIDWRSSVQNTAGDVASTDMPDLFKLGWHSTAIDLAHLIAAAHWLGARLEKTMPSMASCARVWPKKSTPQVRWNYE